MTNFNRRTALGACVAFGGIALASTKAASQSDPNKAGPVSMEKWIELAESAKSIDSPLYMGRFREPMYFLIEPISWTPRFTEARKLSNVTVPKGFVTDLASIPPIFYSFLRPDGEYAYAAIIHDYLYWEQNVSIDTANSTLKAAMQDLKVDPFKVEAIYSAVSWGGQKYWDQNKKMKEQGERRYLQQFPPTAAVSWEDWKKRQGVFRP